MPSWLSNRLKHPRKHMTAGKDDMVKGMSDYQQAIADYAAKGNQQYTNAGDLGPSGMANIKVDPRYAAHEQAALADLEQISKDGMSARDLADIAKNDSRVNRQAAGRQGAIRQNMAARGMSGSGMDLVAQMQSSQDATENQALASMEKNAQAQEGRRQAISQRGQLSGQLSARDFQQQAQQAQAQDSIARFNQANRQQVMNNNTQGANQFAGNVMQAQQGGAQMRYNYGTEQANRQLAGKSTANPLKGALSGASAGAASGNPWVIAGGAAAGVGAEYMAHGGRVPGPVFGPENNPAYDTVPVMASPGETMVTKTDTQLFDSIDDPSVREYIKKKYGSEADMQSAKDGEKYAKIGQGVAGIGDIIANANRDPKVYHNSMQNLGQAPKITQNELQKTDMSGAVNAATKNREGLENSRDEAIKTAFAERKAQLAAQVAAKQAEEGQRRWDVEQTGKGLDRTETSRANQAREAIQRAAAANKPKAEDGASIGNKAVDKDYAKDYIDYTSTGRPGITKNLDLLKGAKTKLEASEKDFFKPSGNIMGRMPDIVRPESDILIQQEVQSAAQSALKAALGSSFTEKEGIRIMNNAYDPTLSPAANITKIDAAIKEIESIRDNQEAKVKQYEATGTLKGLGQTSSVKMKDANGKTFNIPANEAAEAEADGLQRI